MNSGVKGENQGTKSSEIESTKTEFRDGLTRGSDEVPVMGMERRG